ncbi:MAG: hypothetical protein ACTSSH_06755 [Candidatus Heimdallarchaeota archaeon]
MCHLTGYIGSGNSIPLMLKSLEIQEPIIGSQATGLAVMSLGNIALEKAVGPVRTFKDTIKYVEESGIGIGHTRFSLKNVTTAETNSKEKAHPFWNSDQTFLTMHNGTLSNYKIFVDALEKKGYVFRSKSVYKNEKGEEITDYCDSEIFGYLLEEELKNEVPMKQAIRNACRDLRGHFAFVVMHPEFPDRLYIANWMQPCF